MKNRKIYIIGVLRSNYAVRFLLPKRPIGAFLQCQSH